MNLKISLNEDFNIRNICFRGDNGWYNSYSLDENIRITIIKGKDNALVIQEPNKSANRYWLKDFGYLIFLEEASQSEYKINLFEENYVDTILQYLDWRKVTYEVRNS